MNKSRKKSEPRDPQKTAAVKWTAEHFQVTTAYVYSVIGDQSSMSGGQTESIRKIYNKKYSQLKAVLS